MYFVWFPVATSMGVNRVLIFIHFPFELLGLGFPVTECFGLHLKPIESERTAHKSEVYGDFTP